MLKLNKIQKNIKINNSINNFYNGFKNNFTHKPVWRYFRKYSTSQNPREVEKELLFPGAVKSKFTKTIKFIEPSEIVSIPTYRCLGLDGKSLGGDYNPDFDKEIDIDLSLKLYKCMLTINIMDNIMYDAQRQGRLSFYMVNNGEEGISVGSSSALEDSDVIFAQYREAGCFLYRGFSLKNFMNQLFANKDDFAKGRNMPVHYSSKKFNMQPISSPLATQLSHAAGAAYSLKLKSKGSKAIAICYFGEGAASEGDFHAALNIAATRSCPVVYFCRNNGFAISTPTIEQYKGDGIASRAIGYGIETIRVDGNDIFAVRKVTKMARDIALKKNAPVLIEAMSYRVSHHSTSDDSFAYRKKNEVEEWARRDSPITRMRLWLQNKSWWSNEQDKELRIKIRKEILKEFNEAEKVEKPEIGSLFTDTYAKLTPTLKSQIKELDHILETYPESYNLESYEKANLKDLIK